MYSSERTSPGLAPSREVSESVRRALAWLAEEFECSEEEAIRLMMDAAREIRRGFCKPGQATRSLAGVLQDAACTFQLLRELRSGGLPLDELCSTATRIKLRDLVKKLEDKLPDSEERLRQLLEIALTLRKEGIELKRFPEIAAKVRKLMDLSAAIEGLGASETRVRALHELGSWLEQKGITLEQVKGLVQYLTKLLDLGFTVESARAIALASARSRKEGKEGARVADLLIDLAKRGILIQDEIERLLRDRMKLRAEIMELSAIRESHQGHVLRSRAVRPRYRSAMKFPSAVPNRPINVQITHPRSP